MAADTLEYEPLRPSSSDTLDHLKEEIEYISRKPKARYLDLLSKYQDYRVPFFVTTISTLLLLGLSLVLLFRLIYLERHIKHFKYGFRTDVQDAQRYIEYEEKDFTGGLVYNKTSGLIVHDVPPSEARYFGDPAVYPEIDEVWRNLLSDEFFGFTDEEGAPFRDRGFTKFKFDNQYHGELAVYHSLHCLNAIRKHMDKDYYHSHAGLHHSDEGYPPNFSREHMSHCLDQIRQMVQCQSDLTPVPLYYQKDFTVNGNPVYIGTGATHTCRKFENIQKWLNERNRLIKPFGEYHGRDDDEEKHS